MTISVPHLITALFHLSICLAELWQKLHSFRANRYQSDAKVCLFLWLGLKDYLVWHLWSKTGFVCQLPTDTTIIDTLSTDSSADCVIRIVIRFSNHLLWSAAVTSKHTQMSKMSVRRGVRGSFRGSLRRYGSAESSRKPVRHHNWIYRNGEWRIAFGKLTTYCYLFYNFTAFTKDKSFDKLVFPIALLCLTLNFSTIFLVSPLSLNFNPNSINAFNWSKIVCDFLRSVVERCQTCEWC